VCAADSEKLERLMAWVIEYVGTPPCWIGEHKGSGPVLDVTFQRALAKRHTNREDASHEMLRLGLSGEWEPVQIGEVA
jgi:hypothetical protein